MSTNGTYIPYFTEDAGLQHYVYSSPPFYHTTRPRVIESVSDDMLSLIVPVVVYWAYSLFFHALDSTDAAFIEKYRIHESAEVKSKNLVRRTTVVWAVLFQQLVQTVLGIFWMDGVAVEATGPLADVLCIRKGVTLVAKVLLGEQAATGFLQSYGPQSVWFMYWWGIPLSQLIFAMFCIDTWQYFLHRLFHVNKFLYKHFHSWHHRLYVPYAYGALYNHPLEGFLLDTLGAAIAQSLSMMTVRQAIILFMFSTMKTVDDHCGYRLPLDPLQLLFGNNADYHDIHHQVIGIKSNFSQPFFIHWDTILGTRMSRDELEKRRRRSKEKAEKSL